jgi:serine phosphatase RsbU (regulator of sigma subunit)
MGAVLRIIPKKKGLSNNYVWSILEDQSGNLWFGTSGGGVTKYNGSSFTHYTEKEGLSNNRVLSILEDQSGNLWFGTSGGGVTKYNGSSFTHYTEKEGLSNNYVWSILEDQSNNVWVSTEKGLKAPKKGLTVFAVGDGLGNHPQNEKKMKKVTDEETFGIMTFGKQDGLKGVDFFINSAFIDSKNRAWWGSGKGLEMLDLNKFSTATKPPAIFLKQLDINEQFIDYRNISDSFKNEIYFDSVVRFENYPLNLELSYDKNHLTFHFVAIDWSAPHKIQYSYRMLGLDNSWSNPSKEAKAEYRNLSYGTYTFQIRAIGESGKWSEPFEYTFTISPPWWHTWWFRALCVLLALILILILVKWRTAALIKRQKELEKTVEKRTEELVQKNIVVEQQKAVVEQQKHLVEEKNREILDSITYAKRIQSAILPQPKLVKEFLEDSFILYKPKDIVAGDFYWLEVVGDTVLFAAADCTGHGVPGAMVSVVCNNGLNRAVREHKLTEPDQILNKTRELVVEEFEKSDEEVKDGMDISLCALNTKTNTLKWAGANNPLWILRNGEIMEYKADKQPIGKHFDAKPFSFIDVQLEKNDIIYIFTDGFQDQFGGPKEKKYRVAQMRELFLSLTSKTMEEQRKIIDVSFEEWKGNLEQVDDVCVIGVRV